MKTLKSRACAAALATTTVIGAGAALAPSAGAWTAPYTTACSGSDIYVGGSSLQGEAQYRLGASILDTTGYALGTTKFDQLSLYGTFENRENPIWEQGFGAELGSGWTSTFQCEGTGVGVKFARVGSGAGRNSWRANGITQRDPSAALVATDQPPNLTEQVYLQTSGMASTGATIETIPIAQAAVAMIVTPPTGCTATGRAVKLSSLEEAFEGGISTWGQLMPGKLTPSSCNSEPITKVVRSNSSGTTFALKKAFASIDADWNNYTAPSQNLVWPTAVTYGAPTNSMLATTVANTPGSIGYADLGAVRNLTQPAGVDFEWNGTGDTQYWLTVNVPLRGGTPGQTVSVDPALDSNAPPPGQGNHATNLGANCGATRAYNNVPATTKGSLTDPATGNWLSVDGSSAAGYRSYEYPLCTLTYMLAYNKYHRFPNMTQDRARTANDYLRYVVSTFGQDLLAEGDYQRLPSALKTMANEGARRVNW